MILVKLCLVAFLIFLIFAFLYFDLEATFTLQNLKTHQAELHTYFQTNPLTVLISFFALYVTSVALSVPWATALTVSSGVIFGFWLGLAVVSLASSLGATLSFVISRFLFRDWIQRRYAANLSAINTGFTKEGGFYLFSLRLLPIIPFFLVNLMMALTPIKTSTFFLVSLLGMLPATAAFVNAGTQIASLESLRGLLSIKLILSFSVIGIFPYLSKKALATLRNNKFMKKYKRPKKFDYNIVVIGAGSAGLVSSYIASAVKAKVALIEKHKMGGDCLNTGCVPSKALIRSAKMVHYFRRASDFGLKPQEPQFDFAKVMERVQRVIAEIAPHDSVDRYTELGVECIEGSAKITSPFQVQVGERTLTTKNIIVATGAGPLVPPIPGLSEVPYLTSDTVWGLRTLPKRLIVLGGGPIGCELAQSFARFGSQVSLVEMAPRIMSREDPDVSELISQRFTSEGISALAAHKALRVEKDGKILVCEHQRKEVKIPFDEILIALGRKANVKGFGLEELGIEISKTGTIQTDEYLRTTHYPNIYVCGDVAGPFQFTHTAAHQAWFAAVNSLFSPFKKFKADYRVIPWCTFTDPEVARVGLNETEAKQKGVSFEVTRYGIDDLDRAIAEGEAHGFVKVLTPPGSDRILGVTIVGDHAGDIICEYVAAMKHGFGLNKILGTIHIYPTLAEANKYAAGVWKKAHAPKTALAFLTRFHAWRRGF